MQKSFYFNKYLKNVQKSTARFNAGEGKQADYGNKSKRTKEFILGEWDILKRDE